MTELLFPLKGHRNFILFVFVSPEGNKRSCVCVWVCVGNRKCDFMSSWTQIWWIWNEITLNVFETKVHSNSLGIYWWRIFFFCDFFSVCARWWATQGACGHPRWETTLLSAAPLIAHSRSGTQRQENVSTPSMGIPQQCAACTYMRKGTGQSHQWPFL